ncbi:MAG: phage head morphogenesis protein, partial [Prevotella sp.]|nr:phage head morphogenesis protein [Prevotella sp.]
MPSQIRQQLEDKFRGMMKALFNEKGSQLRIDILAEQPAQDFINTHADALNSSFRQVKMSDT